MSKVLVCVECILWYAWKADIQVSVESRHPDMCQMQRLGMHGVHFGSDALFASVGGARTLCAKRTVVSR